MHSEPIHHRLSNGISLVLVPFRGIKTVSLHAYTFVGSAYEPAKLSGISHVLEHMMFRGNQQLGDSQSLSLKMEELGGEINAMTSYDHTEYWLDFHVDFLKLGIERFCKFLTHPQFEQLDTERQIILEEAKSDYNDQNLLIDLDSLTNLTLWPGQSFGQPIIGQPESIEAIQVQDLKDWYQNAFQGENMLFGVSGDFDPQQVIGFLEKELCSLPAGQRHQYHAGQPVVPERSLWLQPNRDNQYQFQWSFPIFELNPHLKVEYQILSRLLDDGSSSRLQRLVREEKGLVYDISASFFYYRGGGLFQIQGTVSQEKAGELAKVLGEIMSKMLEEGFSEAELRLSKLRYQTAMDCYRDNAEGILQEEIGKLLNPYPIQIQETLNYLEKVTQERIHALCRSCFGQRGLFILVGPKDEKLLARFHEALQAWA